MQREVSFKTTAYLAYAVALLAAWNLLGCSGGKGVGGACADVSSCGGDPSGDWKIVSACQFDNFQPKNPNDSVTSRYTAPQSPTLAVPAPSSGSSGDWCQALSFITPSDGMASSLLVRLNSEPVEFVLGGVVSAATVASTPVPFGAVLSVENHFAVHFSPTCLGAHGVPPTCSALAAFGSGGAFLNYNDFACHDAAIDGGCDCTYLYYEGTTESAYYQRVGSQLIVSNASSRLPPRTYDYCIQGSTMTMGGHNGLPLFGSKNLRSVVATRCKTTGCTGD